MWINKQLYERRILSLKDEISTLQRQIQQMQSEQKRTFQVIYHDGKKESISASYYGTNPGNGDTEFYMNNRIVATARGFNFIKEVL